MAEPSSAFDHWLTNAATAPLPERADLLAHWEEAPFARFCHPRAEHLLPLMVAAGASWVLGGAVSAYRFA